MSNIHPSAKVHATAIVAEGARIGEEVEIGPFCLIGENVVIGARTRLRSHVTVDGDTEIGCENLVYAGASIGCDPQDKKYAGEKTRLVIGDRNVIRENCTLSIGTVQDEGITRVGSDNLFMANVHVAHDCRVGSNVIIANNVALAGHVTVEDYAIVGGQTGVHQFVRLGEHSMTGGASAVLRDVPPFVICNGNPCEPHGLNLVGLRRSGYGDDTMRALRKAYGALYRENLTVKEALEKIEALKAEFPESAAELTRFAAFVAASERGIIR